ncbi:FAD:protein FMN transferase [Celeribacter neptunius]|uniref:FAD:protein FMN transferase n=1 Tax=Celeribacter neptunius TaxID=588602 RepID=A0A1I3R7E3_9RHOB|nr:FAD:protein FMN transferase [Celeribacter neptunius]SFJ42248.1 thiamine biosynthesis lipoprotein [Celeribacter neptunius]
MQQTRQIGRRRFLTIASASCLIAAAPAHAFRWQGITLGARAQIILDHPDAPRLSRMAQAEISRLEAVFSLYDRRSELSRLNRAGRLDGPAFELLDCLAMCRRVHDVTEGRFDPTVQPLWQALAEAAVAGRAPAPERLAAAKRAIGFDRLRFDSASVKLAPGQALTLNGIAQGYIADRVAALLRANGIDDVLIDTGEILAMGMGPGRGGWPVSITREAGKWLLLDRAIATSASAGTEIAPGQGHILDPRLGDLAQGVSQISVSAPSAALADGLSTGLILTRTRSEAETLLSIVKESRLESFIL